MSSVKPMLTQSKMNMLFACQVAFSRRYGADFGLAEKNEITPPSIALAIGSVVHVSVEANLRHKIEKGTLVNVEEAKQVTRDAFSAIVNNGGLMLSDEEAIDPTKTLGETVDTAIGLASLHHSIVAPTINPVAVESPFTIDMPHFPFNVGGKIDVIEDSGGLIDSKTADKSPSGNAAVTFQNKLYAWGRKVHTGGHIPARIRYDFLVKNKTPKYVPVEFVPTQAHIDQARLRFERATEVIVALQEGRVKASPAPPDEGWRCTIKYCGYATSCPFASGR